jgi:hypothetical protein
MLITSQAIRITNRLINLTPVVRLAVNFVGSGPERLKMVKLSHELSKDKPRL